MLGMPVQVFPQGPPPPPPVPKAQLAPNNGTRSPSVTRKSPQPQSFEPPPMGCRPEIKIPPNPMAALRKVPQPKPKEVDWTEEYRKERSKSPMPPTVLAETHEDTQLEPTQAFNGVQQYNFPPADKVGSPINTMQTFLPRQTSFKESDNAVTDQNNNFASHNNGGALSSPQQRVFSPFASSPQPNLPKPLSPVKLNQLEENVPIYVRSSQRPISPKPLTPQFEQGKASPVSNFQRQPSVEQTPIYMRSARNVSASPVKQLNQSSFQPTATETENYPIYVRSFQKQPAAPATPPQKPISTAQSFASEPGRQYYQPNRPTNTVANNTQSMPLANQSMPPWMRRSNSKEVPEWANNVDDNNRTNEPQQNNTNNSTYPTTTQYGSNGSNAATQKVSQNALKSKLETSFNEEISLQERVIPIQFEQTPTKMPVSPGFTAQPYQSTPPQYNRVQPPPFAPAGKEITPCQ